jgi:hypothetical protein
VRGRLEQRIALRFAAEWIEVRAEMPVPADALHVVERAEQPARFCASSRSGAGTTRGRRRRGQLREQVTRRRVDRRWIPAVLLVQLEHVSAIDSLKIVPAGGHTDRFPAVAGKA